MGDAKIIGATGIASDARWSEPIELAARVAEIASKLNIKTALIGAGALAVHNYVRGTSDIDLATAVDPYVGLRDLESALARIGLSVRLSMPDGEDALGGVLRVWVRENHDGDPIDPVEIVNFLNPHRPRENPAAHAIEAAFVLDGKPALRCVRLPDLIALKLYAGGRTDLADVVELLVKNPDADLDEIRATCKRYDFDIDNLIEEAAERRLLARTGR